MTLKSKPYYWLECDGDDCDQRYPNVDDEYSAWAEPDVVADLAADDFWQVRRADGRHLCEDCAIDAIDEEDDE